jgi:hypothetical protein
MTRRALTTAAVSTALLVITGVTPAAADPIQITAGTLDVSSTAGSLTLSGERGFTLSAGVSTTDGVFAPWMQCAFTACAPGAALDLSATWNGMSLRSATATLEGESFTAVGAATGSTSAATRFSGTALVPPASASGSAIAVAPFIFTGQFSYFSPSAGALIVETLQGAGIATVTFAASFSPSTGSSAWAFRGARYEFHAAPEPATILLTGGGVLALAARRFRRAHRRRA